MPLVRYLNGDVASYVDRKCSCGRGLPLLASIDGRVLDLLKTPDGRHIPGEYFVNVMHEWPAVKQWQVVQTAMDALQLSLVSDAPLTQQQCAQLIKSMQARIGNTMLVDIKFVERIDATRSGKRRLTVAM